MRFRVLILAGLSLLVLTCSEKGKGPRDSVSARVETEDGVSLGTTFYPVEGAGLPMVIFIHERSTERKAWDLLARRVQAKGMLAVSFDMRGHGESTSQGANKLTFRGFTVADWMGGVGDLSAVAESALVYGADSENVVLVGAGVGGHLALLYALEHAEVQGVVMVSPGLVLEGIKIEDKIGGLDKSPILIIASTGDAYGAESAKKLGELARGFCDVRLYPSAARGTDLIASSFAASEQVLGWLDMIFGK